MLDDLRQNITRLIAMYESEKQRADSLAARLADKEAESDAYSKQITELTRRIDNLKLQSAFMTEGSNKEARERIEKLIKEIDRCIAYLEK